MVRTTLHFPTERDLSRTDARSREGLTGGARVQEERGGYFMIEAPDDGYRPAAFVADVLSGTEVEEGTRI